MKVYDQRLNLKLIIELIQEKKHFSCQVCDKRFAKKYSLDQHQATHSETRSFKCSLCLDGRIFKTKDGLNNHMVLRYDPKIACSNCEYKTHTKSNFKRHEKTYGWKLI